MAKLEYINKNKKWLQDKGAEPGVKELPEEYIIRY